MYRNPRYPNSSDHLSILTPRLVYFISLANFGYLKSIVLRYSIYTSVVEWRNDSIRRRKEAS